MTILLEIAVVAAIVFAAVAYALGGIEGMRPVPPESGSVGLPDGPVDAVSVDRTRFALSFRGYRMDEVDAVLDRLRDELATRPAAETADPGPADVAGVDAGPADGGPLDDAPPAAPGPV